MTRPPDEINAESAPALAALQDLIYRDETPRSEGIMSWYLHATAAGSSARVMSVWEVLIP